MESVRAGTDEQDEHDEDDEHLINESKDLSSSSSILRVVLVPLLQL